MTTQFPNDDVSLDDLIDEMAQEALDPQQLHVTDTQGNLLHLGHLSVLGPDRIQVHLTDAAKPVIGQSLGVNPDRLVAGPVEMNISPLRLANALGINANNQQRLAQQLHQPAERVDAYAVLDYVKQVGSAIMLTGVNEAPAADRIAVIPAAAIVSGSSDPQALMNYLDQHPHPDTAQVFLRNNQNQLQPVDVTVADTGGNAAERHAADTLAFQHAASSALRAQGVTVPETRLLQDPDSARVVQLTVRDGVAPITAIKNMAGDSQTRAHHLHQASGFCSLDRMTLMMQGKLEQHPDASAKLLSITAKRPALLNNSLPLVVFNKMVGNDRVSGNDLGFISSVDNGQRRARLSLNCAFHPPRAETDRQVDITASRASSLDLKALSRMPGLSRIAAEQPALANQALSQATHAVAGTVQHLQALEQQGVVSQGFTASLGLPASAGANPQAQTPFSGSAEAVTRFADKHRQQDRDHVVSLG